MAVGAVAGANNGAEASYKGSIGALDKDVFLKLLITELRNQDPLRPMEDKDFIAQLAQFSSLEQAQKMVAGFTEMTKHQAAAKAFGMIGKQVEFADPQSGEKCGGRVKGVVFEDGWPKLEVGSRLIDPSEVLRVTD
ncbi:MAG: flagellar hook capping FlgD N-terminal domain-containing protein [Armatimonadota bacterium]|nr:flagellar hook capping FlgD N-terminal domain-containing protein [Armatimonadota bacterium]